MTDDFSEPQQPASTRPNAQVFEFHRVQFSAIRKENAAIVEHQAELYRSLNRLQTVMLEWREEMRAGMVAVRKDINELRSEVLTLEGQNASRHGEILNIVRRVDDHEFSAS